MERTAEDAKESYGRRSSLILKDCARSRILTCVLLTPAAAPKVEATFNTHCLWLPDDNMNLRSIMKRIIISVIALTLLVGAAFGQKKPGPPTDAVIGFYRALKQKHYVEGFRHSVYRNAVEGLTPAELQDLEPDFARTFATIPDKIEPSAEQISGSTATVFEVRWRRGGPAGCARSSRQRVAGWR